MSERSLPEEIREFVDAAEISDGGLHHHGQELADRAADLEGLLRDSWNELDRLCDVICEEDAEIVSLLIARIQDHLPDAPEGGDDGP